MRRRVILPGLVLAGVLLSGIGCGGSSATNSTAPTVPDPNGITVPKPAGGKAG
jgi:hypothetical protein